MKRTVQIQISPSAPRHGDSLVVSMTGSTTGVFAVSCVDEAGDVIYGDSRRVGDEPPILASLAWTEGPATCTVTAREVRGGRTYTAGSLEFEVAG